MATRNRLVFGQRRKISIIDHLIWGSLQIDVFSTFMSGTSFASVSPLATLGIPGAIFSASLQSSSHLCSRIFSISHFSWPWLSFRVRDTFDMGLSCLTGFIPFDWPYYTSYAVFPRPVHPKEAGGCCSIMSTVSHCILMTFSWATHLCLQAINLLSYCLGYCSTSCFLCSDRARDKFDLFHSLGHPLLNKSVMVLLDVNIFQLSTHHRPFLLVPF